MKPAQVKELIGDLLIANTELQRAALLLQRENEALKKRLAELDENEKANQ